MSLVATIIHYIAEECGPAPDPDLFAHIAEPDTPISPAFTLYGDEMLDDTSSSDTSEDTEKTYDKELTLKTAEWATKVTVFLKNLIDASFIRAQQNMPAKAVQSCKELGPSALGQLVACIEMILSVLISYTEGLTASYTTGKVEYSGESLWTFASQYFDETALNARFKSSKYELAIVTVDSKEPLQQVMKALSSLAPWLKDVTHRVYDFQNQVMGWEYGWLAESEVVTARVGAKRKPMIYSRFWDGIRTTEHSALAHNTAVAAHRLTQLLRKDQAKWFSSFEVSDAEMGAVPRPTDMMKVGFIRLKSIWDVSSKSLLNNSILAPTLPKIRYFYIRAQESALFTTDIEEFTTTDEHDAIKAALTKHSDHGCWVRKDIRGVAPAWTLNVVLPVTVFLSLLSLLLTGYIAAADAIAYGGFAWGVFSYMWGDVADGLTQQPWELARKGLVRVRRLEELAKECRMSKRRLLYEIVCGSLMNVEVLKPLDVCWFDGPTSDEGCHIGEPVGMRDLATLGLVGYGYWQGSLLGLWDLRPNKQRLAVPFVKMTRNIAHVDRNKTFMFSGTAKQKDQIDEKLGDLQKEEVIEDLIPGAQLRFFYSNATKVGSGR
jgi:hypothetical protein